MTCSATYIYVVEPGCAACPQQKYCGWTERLFSDFVFTVICCQGLFFTSRPRNSTQSSRRKGASSCKKAVTTTDVPFGRLSFTYYTGVLKIWVSHTHCSYERLLACSERGLQNSENKWKPWLTIWYSQLHYSNPNVSQSVY